MNPKSKIKDVKPVRMWAAVSEDVPPEIWEVGFYKDQLQSNLIKIRVTVSPVPRNRARTQPEKLMPVSEIDQEQVKTAFEQANLVLQGKSFAVSVAALQDLIAAAICYAAPTRSEAIGLAEEVCQDIISTVAKNFEHYHAQRLEGDQQQPEGHA